MTKDEFKKTYLEYLKSDKWKYIRINLFNKRGRVCERCDKDLYKKRAEIHHLNYKNLFDEKEEDLQILCTSCHRRVHNLDRAFKYISSKNQEDYFFINQYKKPFTKEHLPKVRRKRKIKKLSNFEKLKKSKKERAKIEKDNIINILNSKNIFIIKSKELHKWPLTYLKAYCKSHNFIK